MSLTQICYGQSQFHCTWTSNVQQSRAHPSRYSNTKDGVKSTTLYLLSIIMHSINRMKHNQKFESKISAILIHTRRASGAIGDAADPFWRIIITTWKFRLWNWCTQQSMDKALFMVFILLYWLQAHTHSLSLAHWIQAMVLLTDFNQLKSIEEKRA